MHPIIRFTTDIFDIKEEDKNPINPIYGQSLLLWLQQKIAVSYKMSAPDYEDWGWYSDMIYHDKKYMIGASSEEDGLEWVLQISKQRSLIEILLGKEKMTDNDKCFLYFKKIIETESSFKNIEFE
ncbi:MAG TPA: hypothetical protein ENJ34_02290 [Epsilonproteobacteria bacterium]|nr:hypothetical protein [Campylobacterota bacterium]